MAIYFPGRSRNHIVKDRIPFSVVCEIPTPLPSEGMEQGKETSERYNYQLFAGDPALPWHPKRFVYRCFLPDLAGFASLRRMGLSLQQKAGVALMLSCKRTYDKFGDRTFCKGSRRSFKKLVAVLQTLAKRGQASRRGRKVHVKGKRRKEDAV